MRITSILLTVVATAMGCDGHVSCIRVAASGEFGTNHLEKIELVFNFVRESSLPTTGVEVATILGAAYAASQVEGGQSGVPIDICFQAGEVDDTEYRVLSTGGKTLIGWRSTTNLKVR